MKDQTFKQVYAILNYVGVLLWGAFTIWIVWRAVALKTTVDIIAAAGASGITGALIVWNGNITQYFFRKAKPETPDANPPGGTP